MTPLLDDLAQMLTFERGRAGSPAQALLAWLRGLAARRQRRSQIGAAAFATLLAAERACANAGMFFPREDVGQIAPWHLPERFLRIPAGDLPASAVFDPTVLNDQLGFGAAGLPAHELLRRLAGPDAYPARWHQASLSSSAKPAMVQPRIAVCLHLFYPELWPAIREQLQNIPEPWDLFLTVPYFSVTSAWRSVLDQHPGARLLPVVNRGRDVWPWLQALRSGAFDGYELVCKLHGKRSPHMSGGGEAWRDALLQGLLGDRDRVSALIQYCRSDPRIGLLGPAQAYRQTRTSQGWQTNFKGMSRLARRLKLPMPNAAHGFFAGTMFWFRPLAMEPLVKSNVVEESFDREAGQTDGTTAHALERLISLVVEEAGFRAECWPVVRPLVSPGA